MTVNQSSLELSIRISKLYALEYDPWVDYLVVAFNGQCSTFSGVEQRAIFQGCHCVDDHLSGCGTCFERSNSSVKDRHKVSLDFSLRLDVGAAIAAASVEDYRPAARLRHCGGTGLVHGPSTAMIP